MAPARRILGTLLVFCAAFLAQVTLAGADSYRTVASSSPQEVVNGMANKAGRGLANMTTGWIELPKQIYLTSEKEGTAQGILLGPLKGIGMTVARTVAGVGEFLTFFIAYPGFYDPYFDPAYVWQKE